MTGLTVPRLAQSLALGLGAGLGALYLGALYLGALYLGVLCLGASGCDAPPQPLAPQVRDCRLHVRIELDARPAQVGVAGTFNNFDARQTPLTADEAGIFSAAIDVPPGRHRYRIEVDGRRALDADNPVQVRHDGAEWSLIDVADCSRPSLKLTALHHRQAAPHAELTLQRIDAPLDARSVRAFVDDAPITVTVDADTIVPDLSAPLGKHRLRIDARDTAGRALETFEAPFWSEPERFRWADATIYQVVLDRFAKDAPFTPADRLRPPGDRLGGTLNGLRAALEGGYFEQFGINAIWISPLNLNPDGKWPGVEGGPPRYESFHSYWPIAPRTVDPRFGTEADVDAFVQAAHARGVRVIMDVVLNHLHADHPYATAHPDWFTPPGCYCGTSICPWFSAIQVCWFTDYLPDLNWDDAAILDTQIDDALWWMRRFDLDGLRVDAVPMMPRFVIRQLTRAVGAEFEGLRARQYLIGETFTGPSERGQIRRYLGPDGLDAQFDFPLMWAIRGAFAWESAPLWTLADAWAQSEAAWAGSTAVMGNFVGNHDVTRFLSEAAGQIDSTIFEQPWTARPPIPDDARAHARLRLAQTYVLTIPGASVLYYGDEFGMPGANDPDNRRPMRFGNERTPLEQATHRFVGQVARLRRCLPALRRGALRPLQATAERLSFARDTGDGRPALVVLNRDDDTPVRLALPPDLRAQGPFTDALSGRRIASDDRGLSVFELAPRAAAVLVPSTDPCLEGAL
ncbi:MAG: glycosidase [Bradymonadia bacterium]